MFPDLLILDEVGVQFGSDTERLLLFDILNERYERRRPTILMSNLALDDAEEGGRVVPGIKSYLGERVFDRLREDGGQSVVFDWPSHRKGATMPKPGEQHHKARLSDAKVREMRAMYHGWQASTCANRKGYGVLGRIFGCSPGRRATS